MAWAPCSASPLRWSADGFSGGPTPTTTPSFPRPPIFADFFEYIPKFTQFHSPRFFLGPPLAYPAATVVLLRPFMLEGDRHVRLSTCFFLAFSLLCFTCAAVFFAKSLVRRGLNPRSANLFVIATFVMAFPIWFDLHQANVESLVWTVTTLGLWAMWTNRSWSAAVLLGYAVALKLFPIILLALFLSRRMYKQLTLLHLYVPLALFCYATLDRAAGRSTASTRILPAGLALLAFLLSLQSEIIWHGVQFPGQCRALALLCLLGIAAFGTLPIVPLGAAQPARDRLQENTI